jgi:hypothetical protein
LGPNLQSRLEALEAAMGVRLNLAKGQGRHSLSNSKQYRNSYYFRHKFLSATSTSPMQISPTSTTVNTTISSSLSQSSRHNIPTRTGQGIQRSASSCDVENRPGPIKRLKPSLPTESASSSTAAAIATIKKYPPPVRRPLTITPIQSKQSTPIKQRVSPMDTSSPRLSRSSTTSNNSSSNSSNYRTPIGGISPKISNTPSPKQTIINSSPPRPPMTLPRKPRLSIFGEQFSDDILKINLLWIDLNELDDESRAEVILQFGSIKNFLSEQNLFYTKQQQQFKMAAKNKTIVNRSRFQLILPKKDRLELL